MILSIETATSNCSVALHTLEGQLIAVKERNEHNIHASQLFVFIEELLKEQNIRYAQIKCVAVGKGPGSYTGLRIGVSASKGLCYSLNIPLISINTLMGMAYTAQKMCTDESALLIPMLDARRMEVYNAIYNYDLMELQETRATIIDEFSYAEWDKRTCCFFGDGMPKCRNLLEKKNRTLFLENILASASAIGTLAARKYELLQFEDMAYFEPYYLKDFVSQSTFHHK